MDNYDRRIKLGNNLADIVAIYGRDREISRPIYVFSMDLRINSDYFSLQHYLSGFYNRSRECLQRGTSWVFKSD